MHPKFLRLFVKTTCLFVSMYLCLSPLSLYLSQTLPNLKSVCLPAWWSARPPARPSLSPSLSLSPSPSPSPTLSLPIPLPLPLLLSLSLSYSLSPSPSPSLPLSLLLSLSLSLYLSLFHPLKSKSLLWISWGFWVAQLFSDIHIEILDNVHCKTARGFSRRASYGQKADSGFMVADWPASWSRKLQVLIFKTTCISMLTRYLLEKKPKIFFLFLRFFVCYNYIVLCRVLW